MKVFVTGATGFIGQTLVRKLRERGDEVRAGVRNPDKAAWLRDDLGCELIVGTLADRDSIRRGLEGCDAAVHQAAIYELGIPASRRHLMYEANVLGTEAVLSEALAAGVKKAVYVSSVVAFGDTQGRIVDETHEPTGPARSYYEETKRDAHQIARRLIAEGLPLTIVQPGGVYGPNDHSELGGQIIRAARGRMPYLIFPESRITMVHVEDVADGIVLALDSGVPGESYVLGGETTTMKDLLTKTARLAGQRPPLLPIPTALVRLGAPLGPLVGPLFGYPPNFGELIGSGVDATYLADDGKAREQLGYSPRGLDDGLRDTLAAEGLLRGD